MMSAANTLSRSGCVSNLNKIEDVTDSSYLEFDGINDTVVLNNPLLFPARAVGTPSFLISSAYEYANTLPTFWFYKSKFWEGNRDYTVEFIIKDFATAQSGIGYLVVFDNGNRIGFNGNSKFYWNVRGIRYTDSVANIFDLWELTIPVEVIKSNWNYVRYEYNSTTKKRSIWVNNTKIGEVTNLVETTAGGRTTFGVGSVVLLNNIINTGQPSFGTSSFYKGKIRSFTVFPRLLTEEEKTHRYNSGAFNLPLNKVGQLAPIHWIEFEGSLQDLGSLNYTGNKMSGFPNLRPYTTI